MIEAKYIAKDSKGFKKGQIYEIESEMIYGLMLVYNPKDGIMFGYDTLAEFSESWIIQYKEETN